ncbi:hypothetical protein ACKWTF_011371 [Chironomus riparius]
MCDSTKSGCFFIRGSKDNGRSVPDLTASPGRAPHPGPNNIQNQQNAHMQRQGGMKEPVLLQGDFRKVSGISSEIFRQIEAVENDHDPSTAAALDAVERRGEMIVRVLEPRCIGSRQSYESAQKFLAKADSRHTVQMVEIVKRPGQTLGLYIREGNGADRSDGVFISRIALESAVYNSGCLRVSDEILAVNLVDVTKMSLDDVVIIMSIPRRLVLAIRTRRGRSTSPPPLQRSEQKPPVVVIKRDLRDDQDMMLDEPDHMPRSRSSRERRDGREMSESRSRLGLGLTNYSPQSEQIDLYYNSRSSTVDQHTPNWGYKPPAPPSVITEQPKGAHQFQPSHAYYQNAGTLESLAEKVHQFYPGPSRRMSDTRAGVSMSQSHQRFPRSGSADILPRVEYSDFSASLGRHSFLRSSMKSGQAPSPQAQLAGGTLGRYGPRYDQQSSRNAIKYSSPTSSATLGRQKPPLDYSSDTEATIGRQNYYYYNNRPSGTMGRGGTAPTAPLTSGADFAKFNSLPRNRNDALARMNLRSRLVDRIGSEDDGNLSAPEYSLPTIRRDRDLRQRISTNPSIFTSDEYRAWLRRAPSSSAICEQMRASRDILNQQRAHRFSCSAENIHDALKNTENIYSGRARMLGTLDRNSIGLGARSGIGSLPVRSLSSQHIGGPSSAIRSSPNIRRMRQLLELSTGAGNVQSPGSMSGHQSPAPTPSTTLPRTQRQIDINPAEFTKYKLDKPIMETQGTSGMLWLNLLAGRGLRATPEGIQTTNTQVRDLYCVIECDRVHKARTVVRSGDLQFDWDESFELDLVNNKQLDVLIYSWDPQHRHKLCYRGAIAITSLIRQAPIHQLALKVEPRGTIYLRMRYNDPLQLYRRRGVPALRGGVSTALFGVDLETVVTREAKGAPGNAPVPIVLRRCVEEIERRGLDIIGLYRLCGSATKKRLLREAFERNSRAVELSPEHIPDINVITGVIKDYLRELPEPLFTRCLFQMTVDALGVCLPDDPEGNAKLMLSILDCLPRANRATLVFLLDHLSLVVSASERNKMSAQALATALGPPLMLHSSGAPTDIDIDHAQPIAVLKYLLQIWPQPATAANISGMQRHANEQRTGQRGSKVNALQVAKQHLVVVNNTATSLARTQLSVTVSNPQFQSAVGQLAQSHRVLQPVAQTSLQLVASSGSLAVQDQSQPLATPSPSSSSASSDSGSGTETIKRGASPPTSITDSNTILKESNSSNSIKQQSQEQHKSSTIKQQFDTKDETTKRHHITESSTSGPTTQSYDMSVYTKNSMLPSTSSVSSNANHQYKHYSSISTTKSSPIDKYTNSVGTSNGKSEISKELTSIKKNGDLDDITLYKPSSYSTSSMIAGTSSSSSASTDAKKAESSSSAAANTSTTVTTNGKHKITNNFKLPPFPIYVPPTDLPLHLTSSTSSLAGLSSKNEPTSTAFSGTSKYSDSLTSSTTTTLGRLSNVSSSRTITNSANTPNTNTLPLHLGRTNPYLYQSDSNNFNNATATSSISPATTTSSYLSQSNYNNIYSTLPKTTGSSSTTSKFDTMTKDNNGSSGAGPSSYSYNSYSTDYYSNLATTNNNNTSSNTSTYTSSNVSENIYRVQYSATNPFLDPIDTNVTTQTASDNMSSIFTATRNGNSGSSSMSVSEIARKFEKLDSEEDLK